MMQDDRPITAAEVPSLVDAPLVLIEESDPAQGVTELQHPGEGD